MYILPGLKLESGKLKRRDTESVMKWGGTDWGEKKDLSSDDFNMSHEPDCASARLSWLQRRVRVWWWIQRAALLFKSLIASISLLFWVFPSAVSLTPSVLPFPFLHLQFLDISFLLLVFIQRIWQKENIYLQHSIARTTVKTQSWCFSKYFLCENEAFALITILFGLVVTPALQHDKKEKTREQIALLREILFWKIRH